MEVEVAQIDLLAHDEAPSGSVDALAKRTSVVRLGVRERRHLFESIAQRSGEFGRAIPTAVLGQDHLEGTLSKKRAEAGDEVFDALVQDRGLVVDRDDDGDLGVVQLLSHCAASIPARMLSSIEL